MVVGWAERKRGDALEGTCKPQSLPEISKSIIIEAPALEHGFFFNSMLCNLLGLLR